MSTSTVDRVLNNREGVSERSRIKVINAAQRLGTNRVLPSLTHGLVRVDVIFQGIEVGYARLLEKTLREIGPSLESRLVLQVSHWDASANAEQMNAFVQATKKLRHGALTLIAASFHQRVKEALQQSDIPIVSLRSDDDRVTADGSVAAANEATGQLGRLAAEFARKISRGNAAVLVVIPARCYQWQHEKISSFATSIRLNSPWIDCLSVRNARCKAIDGIEILSPGRTGDLRTSAVHAAEFSGTQDTRASRSFSTMTKGESCFPY